MRVIIIEAQEIPWSEWEQRLSRIDYLLEQLFEANANPRLRDQLEARRADVAGIMEDINRLMS